MPWMENENGMMDYVPSRYEHDELPTWDEVFNGWYKREIYDFNMERDGKEIMPYYDVPKNLYYLAMICNQFNKMITEDGFRDLIHDTLSESILEVRFGMFPEIDITSEEARDELNGWIKSYDKYPIYTFSKEERENRIRVTTEKYNNVKLYMMMCVDNGECPVINLFTKDVENDKKTFDILIEYLIMPYRKYFSNGVGWKDENGNIISDKSSANNCESGSDPAL